VSQAFISYSRADKVFVRQLYDALATAKRDTWVDWEGIPLTARWRSEICSGIEAADNFIFVITPESVSSAACQEEIAYAKANNKRLIPIVRRPVAPNDIPKCLA
jgi:hypothetical protein